MTFISGAPFHAEAIQEEEESDGGSRKISNSNIVTITPATPSQEQKSVGSSPNSPQTAHRPGSGQSQDRNNSAGKRSYTSSGRNTPSSGRNTPGNGVKGSHHRNGSTKVRGWERACTLLTKTYLEKFHNLQLTVVSQVQQCRSRCLAELLYEV